MELLELNNQSFSTENDWVVKMHRNFPIVKWAKFMFFYCQSFVDWLNEILVDMVLPGKFQLMYSYFLSVLTVHNVFLARWLYGRTPVFSRGSYEILVDNNCRIGDWVTWYRNFTTEISMKNSFKHVKPKYACKKHRCVPLLV